MLLQPVHDYSLLISPSLDPKPGNEVSHDEVKGALTPRRSVSTVSDNRTPIGVRPLFDKQTVMIKFSSELEDSIQGGRFAANGQSFALLQADARKLWVWHFLSGGSTWEEKYLPLGFISSIVNWSYEAKCIAMRSDKQRCVWAIGNSITPTVGSIPSETRTRNVRVSLTPDADGLIEVSRSSIKRYQSPNVDFSATL
jgi:hypothetical protein